MVSLSCPQIGSPRVAGHHVSSLVLGAEIGGRTKQPATPESSGWPTGVQVMAKVMRGAVTSCKCPSTAGGLGPREFGHLLSFPSKRMRCHTPEGSPAAKRG